MHVFYTFCVNEMLCAYQFLVVCYFFRFFFYFVVLLLFFAVLRWGGGDVLILDSDLFYRFKVEYPLSEYPTFCQKKDTLMIYFHID